MKSLNIGICFAALAALPAFSQPADYPTPQAAYDALITAVETRDEAGLETIMGPEGVDLVLSEDQVENRVNKALFLELVQEGYRFVPIEEGVEIVLGVDSWPFPIPLTQTDAGWHFDVETGREEILAREIGLNELTVIELMLAYTDLQAQFRLADHDGDGVMEFAQSILSDDTSRDGLFWPGADSLVGAALARAAFDGWSDGIEDFEPEPFMGYYFTILHAQGDNAAGGAYSYMMNGNLVAGHALMAVPAAYDETGVHSFLVGENGLIYEADFGEETLETAGAIATYDPSDVWALIEDVEGVN